MAARKNTSRASAVAEPAPPVAAEATALDAAGRYVGQWNRLVSTTNWEKGRIICQWRDALVAADAAASSYSDEAWTQLVGGVTSQHVGRLRRVFQRFGEMFDQYDGLYWSHFQAAIDWQDAEMWLEGAIQNEWSVSQMRGKRWETLGSPGEAPTAGDEAESGELDDDAAEELTAEQTAHEAAAKSADAVKAVGAPSQKPASREADDEADEEKDAAADREPIRPATKTRARLAVDVDDLPDDLADAFEQFKLAIIAQRRTGWSDATPEAVLACLDALRALTLAPADD